MENIPSNPQKNEIKFSFTLTKEEYAKGLLSFGSSKNYLVFGVTLVLAASISSVIDDYYIDSPQWPLKLFIFLLTYTAGYLLFLFLMRWFMRILLYQSYKKNKTFRKPMSFEFSEKGIEIKHAIGRTSLEWEAYDKYIWSEDLCILFISQARQMIPLRIFSELEKREFKDILTQHIGMPANDKTS